MDYKKIGEYIQKNRKNINLTQAELGEKLGVTSKAVSKWECGVALPDVALFDELCKILNIDVSELLNGQDNEKMPVDKKKNIFIIFLSIFIILSLIGNIILGLYFINNHDRVQIYELSSMNKDFEIKGNIITIDEKSYISISSIILNNTLKRNQIAFAINCELYYKNKLLYRNRDLKSFEDSDKEQLWKFVDSINIVTSTEKKIIDNKYYFILKINFLDENKKIQRYTIPLMLKKTM